MVSLDKSSIVPSDSFRLSDWDLRQMFLISRAIASRPGVSLSAVAEEFLA
jgi:hypothetical protein